MPDRALSKRTMQRHAGKINRGTRNDGYLYNVFVEHHVALHHVVVNVLLCLCQSILQTTEPTVLMAYVLIDVPTE